MCIPYSMLENSCIGSASYQWSTRIFFLSFLLSFLRDFDHVLEQDDDWDRGAGHRNVDVNRDRLGQSEV